MLVFLKDFFKFRLLPCSEHKDAISSHRDIVLTWVHIIAILSSGLLFLASFKISQEQVLPMLVCNLVSIGLMYTYKRYGNYIVSGNLLVALLAAVLLSGMMSTGGMYSDNLLWMLLVPITAYLFTTRKWGKIWSIFVVTVICGLYYVEITADTSYRNVSLALGAEYFLVSYLGLFTVLIGIVRIFVAGNENLLESLQKASDNLKAHSQELEAKNALLLKQEEALKRSNRDLELFAYVASHDLKEPLRMINSYAKLLDKSMNGSMSSRDQEFMKYIKEGGTRMSKMLEDLLAYGKLGQELAGEDPVNLEHTLLIVEKNLKLRLLESSGSIQWSDLPTIKGRSTSFIQLFQNLIANSLKFSREGVNPTIVVTCKQEDDMYKIRLVDNGIGIKEGDLDRIFGAFQRLGNQNNYEGSGLGLATVDRIMESLGGTINVESEFGLGTTFTLSIPLDRVVTSSIPETSFSRN